jgi:hypothetical protein
MKGNLNLELEKVFGKTKFRKISINIEDETLEKVDKLAKISGNTRTGMLGSLIDIGIKPQIELITRIWENMKKDKKYLNNLKIINEKLDEIKKLK